jgi:YhcH/YjgK/YiaL family protein
MILSNLKNRKELEQLHPLFPVLFDYIESHDILSAPQGIIEIQGHDLYLNNYSPEPATCDTAPLEVHQKYIDIQVLLEGSETMGWTPAEEITEWRGEYDEQKDVRFSDERCDHFVTLKAGELTVFYPEDGHAPAIGSAPIRKFIAKLKKCI